MKVIKYDIMVEGSYHSSVKTYKEALKRALEYRHEGWNVRIEAVYLTTLLGEMGVSI